MNSISNGKKNCANKLKTTFFCASVIKCSFNKTLTQMPVTSEKNLGGGEKKLISFRKNNNYLFPNL